MNNNSFVCYIFEKYNSVVKLFLFEGYRQNMLFVIMGEWKHSTVSNGYFQKNLYQDLTVTCLILLVENGNWDKRKIF